MKTASFEWELEHKGAKRSKSAKRVATLTIQAPGKMTRKGRSDIAVWLMRQARNLVKDGDNYTKVRFTAGYNIL